MLLKLVWLAAAGALGTLARFGLVTVMQRWLGEGFPWGTLAVNVLGCFLFGLIFPLAEERLVISTETRLIILMGFMGAFTTFSTLVAETGWMLEGRQWLLAALNFGAQNVLGFVCLFLGLSLSRWYCQ
jgi:fluoride exporter